MKYYSIDKDIFRIENEDRSKQLTHSRPFLYSLKASEKYWLNVFRGYRKGTLT